MTWHCPRTPVTRNRPERRIHKYPVYTQQCFLCLQFTFGTFFILLVFRLISLDSREIVGESKCSIVGRIRLTIGSSIARTQITLRIELWQGRSVSGLLSALPGSLRAVGRTQNPRVCQRIKTSMWVMCKLEFLSHCKGKGKCRENEWTKVKTE